MKKRYVRKCFKHSNRLRKSFHSVNNQLKQFTAKIGSSQKCDDLELRALLVCEFWRDRCVVFSKMGDWDDEEENDLVAKQLKASWDDDDDDAVPDSWDAEPSNQSASSKPAAPAPAKLSLTERRKLKDEQKRKDREERLRKEEELKKLQPATELQREKLAEEAELGLLTDTFGPTIVQSSDKETIDSCCPKTKEEFNRLHELLLAKITTIQKSPHYTAFAESLIRDLVIEMEVDNLRTVNTVINALISEKQKLIKSKTKKKTKGKLLVERENDYNYGGEDDAAVDEYDDFM
ncbi:unnamed protein product [Heterobilharzia americana]|nr:unnamed protein product [Heterobilharzia americana]